MSANGMVGSRKSRLPTANERLRARWANHVRWSVVAAVVLHAAAFAFSPTWTVRRLELDSGGFGDSRLIALGAIDGSPVISDAVRPVASPVPVSTDAPAADPLSPPGGPVGSDDGVVALSEAWEALDQRLRGRGPLTPTLSTVATRSERGAPPEEDGPTREEAEQDDPEIEVDESAPDVTLPEPDSLRLERLATVRPELALMTTSAWVLIRNQTEVEAYLRRSYDEGRLDESAEGSVSVTLWIDQQGSVEWAEITETSGRPELDEFALALFNEVADFRAARERGETVSRSVTFSLTFPW